MMTTFQRKELESCLLADVSLSLLRNNFYSPDGHHRKHLVSLLKNRRTSSRSRESSLQKILGISEPELEEKGNWQSEVIVLEGSKKNEECKADAIKLSDENVLKPPPNRIHLEEDRPPAPAGQNQQSDNVLNAKATNKHFKYKINDNIGPEDIEQRLVSIIKACSKEYDEMKEESSAAKEEFVQQNGHIREYYLRETRKLLKEYKILTNFVKFIEKDPTCPKDVLQRVISDVHKITNLINSTYHEPVNK